MSSHDNDSAVGIYINPSVAGVGDRRARLVVLDRGL